MSDKGKNKDKNQRPVDLELIQHLDGWIDLIVPSSFETVQRIEFLFEQIYDTILDEQELNNLKYAIRELCNNAIEWGNKQDFSKKVRVSYCLFEDDIIIKIEDEGEGFNRELIPDPSKDLFELYEVRAKQGKRTGGFGIYMSSNIMDNILYNEKGNALLMRKKIK